MGKVYAVLAQPVYNEDDILSVHVSRESAEKEIEALILKWKPTNSWAYGIKEYELKNISELLAASEA